MRQELVVATDFGASEFTRHLDYEERLLVHCPGGWGGYTFASSIAVLCVLYPKVVVFIATRASVQEDRMWKIEFPDEERFWYYLKEVNEYQLGDRTAAKFVSYMFVNMKPEYIAGSVSCRDVEETLGFESGVLDEYLAKLKEE